MKCRDCKHFFITFDQRVPYGCRVYQIKSAKLPSLAVKDANSGQECIGFSPKDRVKNKAQKDLNHESNW